MKLNEIKSNLLKWNKKFSRNKKKFELFQTLKRNLLIFIHGLKKIWSFLDFEAKFVDFHSWAAATFSKRPKPKSFSVGHFSSDWKFQGNLCRRIEEIKFKWSRKVSDPTAKSIWDRVRSIFFGHNFYFV